MRVLTLIPLLLLSAAAAPHPAPRHIEVAPGVHLFITAPYGDVGLDGNAVAVLSNDGVLVFDSNGTPAAAAAVIDQIRGLTHVPVRFVVNSHWHWDHWYGTESYTRAFPGVHVVAHEKTRDLMMGPAIEFNRPGLESQLPAYIDRLAQRAAADPSLKPLLDADRFFLDEKRHARLVFPDLTYSTEMDIHLGDRDVRLLHYDRAVTPGDTFIYLPKERIVLAGDVLVNPVSFALGCYPTAWLHTLEKIDALDADVIVPGHGEPLHDKRLLHAQMDVMRRLLQTGRNAKARGLDADEARDEVFPALHDLMVSITGDDPKQNENFRIYLVDWFMHRVYDELDGPLTDAIAPIPRK